MELRQRNRRPAQRARAEILRELVAIFHREDPTRLVTAGCDQIAAEPRSASPEFLGLLDVVGYNYADRWRERRSNTTASTKPRIPTGA